MYDTIETRRAIQNIKKQQYFVNGNTQQPPKSNIDRRNGVLKTSPSGVMSARSNDGMSQKEYAELFGCTFRDSHSYIWNQNEYMNMETFNGDKQSKWSQGYGSQNESKGPYFTKPKGPAVIPSRAVGDSGIRETMLKVSNSYQQRTDKQSKRQNSLKQNQDTKRQSNKSIQPINNQFMNQGEQFRDDSNMAVQNLKKIVTPLNIDITPQSIQAQPSNRSKQKDIEIKISSPLYQQFGEKQTSTYRTVKQQLAQKMPTQKKSTRSNLNFTRKSQKSVQSPRDQTSNEQVPSPIDDDYDSDLELLNPFLGEKDRRPNMTRYSGNHVFDFTSNISKKSPFDDSQQEPTISKLGSQQVIPIKRQKDTSSQGRQSSYQQLPLSSRTEENQISQDQATGYVANSKVNKPDAVATNNLIKNSIDQQPLSPISATPQNKYSNTFGGYIGNDYSQLTHKQNQHSSIPLSINQLGGVEDTSLKKEFFTANFLESSNPKSHRHAFSGVQENPLIPSLDVLNCQSAYLGNKLNQIIEANAQQTNQQSKSVDSNFRQQGKGIKDFDSSRLDLPKGYPISPRLIAEKGIAKDPEIDIQLQRILGPQRATDMLNLKTSPTRLNSMGSPKTLQLSKALGTGLLESGSTVTSQRFYSPVQTAYFQLGGTAPRIVDSLGLKHNESRICGQIQKLTQAIEELKKPIEFMAENLRADIEYFKQSPLLKQTSNNSNQTFGMAKYALQKNIQKTFRQN